MFKKNKVSSAVTAILATTMALSLSGCLVDGDKSTSTSVTGGSFVRVSDPVGMVSGVVQDTNGNPVVGASVYLAGQKKITDEAGGYVFSRVPVTNTVGADTGAAAGGALTITVLGTAGYLGATVTVRPQAQIDGTQAAAGDGDIGVTTFIDGYIASAGVAVLPAMTSTVNGILRNADTGEAIANAPISLDFENTNGVVQQQVQNGVTTSYQTLQYSTISGSDGSFSIVNVPTDSELRFVVDNHAVAMVGANVGGTGDDVVTNDETGSVNVGNLAVTPILALDVFSPFVTAVTGIVNPMAGTGVFNDDVTDTIVVEFSESMAGLVDANSIVVRDTTAGAYVTLASATLAADGMSLTLVAAAAIDPGTVLHVHLLQADFQDSEGNILTSGTDVGFDSASLSATGASYVRLTLQMFEDSNTNAPAVTLTQEFEDTTGDNNVEDVQLSSSAFTDVDDLNVIAMGDFQQLNNADDDDTFGDSDAGSRLSALASALAGGAVVVNTDVARISFTPTAASFYEITVLDSDGDDVTGATTSDAVSGNTSTGPGGMGGFDFYADDNNAVVILLSSVEPGYTVIITPYDDFSYAGAVTSIALVDHVEPTTVLQNSYGAMPDESGVVLSYDFGDGGELTSVGASTVGTPYLNVTAQLIDNLDSNGDDLGSVGTGLNDNVYEYELFVHNTEVLPATTPRVNYIDNSRTYDATAYAVLNANLARTFGVAMSEDVTLTAVVPVYSGSASLLSNYVAHNDVTSNDAGKAVNVDLVNVDVSNVFTLAADDGATIDFVSAIADDEGNVASIGNNAKVVIRDAMPPLVVDASYSGDKLSIQFNEIIAPEVGDSIELGNLSGMAGTNTAFVLTQETITAFDLQADKTVLNIPATDANWLVQSGNTGAYADLTQGAHVLAMWDYTEAAYGATTGYHGELYFGEIADVNGNTWDTDTSGVAEPLFAFYSAVPVNYALSAVTGSTNFNNGSAGAGATVVFTYSMNHAIDMQTTFGLAQGDNSLTASEVDTYFGFVAGAGSIDAADPGTRATLSPSGKILTVEVVLATGLSGGGDSFEPSVAFDSDYDVTQSVAATALTRNN